MWGRSRCQRKMSRAWGMSRWCWNTLWRIQLEKSHTRKLVLDKNNCCLTCCKKFKNRHNKRQHKCFLCSRCGSVFNKEEKLREHDIFNHRGKQCPQCGIKIANRVKYNLHVLILLYRRHVKDVHTEAECKNCGIKCENKFELTQHNEECMTSATLCFIINVFVF